MNIKLAVFKFASCDGCQLQILNMENEILQLTGKIEIAYFMEATSRKLEEPYDIALVEGSISTKWQEKHIKKIRANSKYLIAIGACATAGGIQALRNWSKNEDYSKKVYPKPEWIDTLAESKPISDYVNVDYEVRGCPVNKDQLLWILSQLIIGKEPFTPTHSLCIQCKIEGNTCIMVADGKPCLGPITMAGCGALCPKYNRGCYGCFGPMDASQAEKLAEHFINMGMSKREVTLMFKGFTSWSKPFRKVVSKYGGDED